ncbi:hypothetical protein SNE40_013712 [Patella caerulea]|uniref:Uncharacterized protein n=1 Tax=Patella caerulea TaxID=87958 RepID=A0AAN8JC50_PATCE
MFPEIIVILASILIEGVFGGIRFTRFTRYTRYTGYYYTTYYYGYRSSYYSPSAGVITGAVFGCLSLVIIVAIILALCCRAASRGRTGTVITTTTTSPTVSYINTAAPQSTVTTYPDTNSNLESRFAPPSYDSAVAAYPPQPMPNSTYPPQSASPPTVTK